MKSGETPSQKKPRGSWEACPTALIRSSLQDGAVRLYLLLKTYQGEGGCTPAQKTLAAAMRCNEKSVRRYAEQLREAGWISWKRKWIETKHGPQQVSEYTIFSEPQLTGPDCPLSDRSGMSTQSKRLDKKAPTDWTKGGRLTGQESPRNSDYEIHTKNPHSLVPSIMFSETPGAPELEGRTDGLMEGPVSFPSTTESRFPDGYVQTVQYEFRRARGQVLTGSEVRKFLEAFADVDEANAYLKHRWNSVNHRKLVSAGGYVADAQTWVKGYREDLAKGSGWVYGIPDSAETALAENDLVSATAIGTSATDTVQEPEIRTANATPEPPKQPACDTEPSWQRWRDAEAGGDLRARLVMEAARSDSIEAANQLAASRYRIESGVLIVIGPAPFYLLKRVASRLDGLQFSTIERGTAEAAA